MSEGSCARSWSCQRTGRCTFVLVGYRASSTRILAGIGLDVSNVLFLLEQEVFNVLRGMISMWEVLAISQFVRSGGDMTMRVENNNSEGDITRDDRV